MSTTKKKNYNFKNMQMKYKDTVNISEQCIYQHPIISDEDKIIQYMQKLITRGDGKHKVTTCEFTK